MTNKEISLDVRLSLYYKKTQSDGIEIIIDNDIEYGCYIEKDDILGIIQLNDYHRFDCPGIMGGVPINILLERFYPDVEFNFIFGFHKRGMTLGDILEIERLARISG